MNAPATELQTWLEAAWDRHDREPRPLLAELTERASALPDDASGADAVRLARHVAIAHLGDVAALRAFVARLPAGQEIEKARAAAQWAAETLEGGSPPPLPAALRWGPLSDVAAAEVERGLLAQARARLVDVESEASGHADPAVRRAYAAACNNLASALRFGPRGDAARDALMIEFAELSRRAWARAGHWMNEERADYLLAHCHAVIGQGAQALAHAHACLKTCEANGADAGERFFAHEAMLVAHRAAGDAAAAAAQRARMAALLPQVEDEGLRDFCRRTLEKTPQ